MGRIDVYCYYSISKGDINSFALRIGKTEYTEKLDGKNLADVCKHSIAYIENIVGLNYNLYCNEVDSVNKVLKKLNGKCAEGIYSKSPRDAKALKNLVVSGRSYDTYYREEAERNIRDSIIRQNNQTLEVVKSVKGGMKYIEREQSVSSKDTQKEVNIYLKWSRGIETDTGRIVKCACVSENLDTQYCNFFVENEVHKGSSKPEFISDVLDKVINGLKEKYTKINVHINNKSTIKSLEEPKDSKLRQLYCEVNNSVNKLKNQGVAIEFNYVTYDKYFEYPDVTKTLNLILKQ